VKALHKVEPPERAGVQRIPSSERKETDDELRSTAAEPPGLSAPGQIRALVPEQSVAQRGTRVPAAAPLGLELLARPAGREVGLRVELAGGEVEVAILELDDVVDLEAALRVPAPVEALPVEAVGIARLSTVASKPWLWASLAKSKAIADY